MTAVSRGIGITDKEQVSRLVSTRFTRLPICLGGAYSGISALCNGQNNSLTVAGQHRTLTCFPFHADYPFIRTLFVVVVKLISECIIAQYIEIVNAE